MRTRKVEDEKTMIDYRKTLNTLLFKKTDSSYQLYKGQNDGAEILFT